MPVKPTKDQIEAGKKQLDPKAVLEVIINETLELKQALLDAGLVEEIQD